MNREAYAYMRKSQIKSMKMVELEQEIENGNVEALSSFWSSIVETGTPLVEELSQDENYSIVTFVYKGNEGIENVVFIPPIDWQNCTKYKMKRLLSTDLWYISLEFRNNLRFEYFISVNDSLDDDWEKREERLTFDRFNRNYIPLEGKNGEEIGRISFAVMPKAEEHTWIREKKTTNKGIIQENKFVSSILNAEIKLDIYIPYGYTETSKPNNFLILQDGQDYLGTLSAKNVLDNLIEDNRIAPVVAVFIHSNDSRYEYLSCNDNYVDFIVKELMSWLRENFNISHEARAGIVSGFSLGGLTSTYLGLKHSDIFGNILSQSGAFWYKPEDCVEVEGACWISSEFMKTEKLPLKLYLNVGVLEEKESMLGVNMNLLQVLKAKGYEVEYEEFNSGHDYLCWGETLATGLISLVGN